MKKRVLLLSACVLLAVCLLVAVGADNDTGAVAAKISLPPVLLQGHSYDLNVPADENGQLSLSVNGTACPESFVAEGDRVTLVYTDANGENVGEYTLDVVDTASATNRKAYFSTVEGNIDLQENENDMTFSFGADCALAFAKELNVGEFSVKLELPREASNYQAMVLTLTDSKDARVSISLRVEPATGMISAGEKSAEAGWGDSLTLSFKNRNQTVLAGDEKLFVCETDDRGNEFTGFSGGVYMTLAFEGVSGSSQVRLTRLVNQPIGHKNDGSKDITEPTLVLTTDLYTTQYIGDTFNIPGLGVYDVLSPVKAYTVSVELPDGSTQEAPFEITQYGRYKINYRVEDDLGNIGKMSKMVYVNDDIAPELTVSAMSKTEYKLGDVVTLPTYTATDNQNMCFVDVIAMLPNGEIRLLTHDANGEITYCLTDSALYNDSFIHDQTGFKAEHKGEYTLRYVAYDDQYNRTVSTCSFTVK